MILTAKDRQFIYFSEGEGSASSNLHHLRVPLCLVYEENFFLLVIVVTPAVLCRWSRHRGKSGPSLRLL